MNVTELVHASTFSPANRQIRARNAFYQQNPGQLPDSLTAAICVEMGAPQALLKWWSTPGFGEWWTSPSWEKEESQRLLVLAMQAVSGILRDPADADTALKAAREAREIYTKLNVADTRKFADESIGEMDRRQLEEYIRRNTTKVAT